MTKPSDPREYTAPPDLLRERIILVSGAGDGIGRAVAKAFAAHGARVILHGRTISKLESIYDEIIGDDNIGSGAPRPTICPLDLEKASWESYLELARVIEEEFGRLDGLLHNAGILGDRSPIEHYDVLTWQRVLHVNLTAAFCLTRACLPLLKNSEDASVVFTSSGVGRKGRAYWGAYAASKFGTEGLMQVLADETEVNTPIRVNSINPGKTRTAMRRQAYPFEDPETLVTAEALLPTYLYLFGPDSRGVTGQTFDAQ